MLPRSKRLTRAQCDELFLLSKVVHGEFIMLRYQYTEAASKGTVIISKKIVKKAHDRNRCKRRVRSSLSNVLKEENKKIHFIVSIKKDCREVDFGILQQDIERCFRKI